MNINIDFDCCDASCEEMFLPFWTMWLSLTIQLASILAVEGGSTVAGPCEARDGRTRAAMDGDFACPATVEPPSTADKMEYISSVTSAESQM